MDRLSIITLGAAMALSKSTVAATVAEAMKDFDNGITLKGSVNYYNNLPASDNEIGDMYIVLYAGTSGSTYLGERYIWDGEAWRSNGSNLMLYRDEDGDLCEED